MPGDICDDAFCTNPEGQSYELLAHVNERFGSLGSDGHVHVIDAAGTDGFADQSFEVLCGMCGSHDCEFAVRQFDELDPVASIQVKGCPNLNGKGDLTFWG